MIFGNRRSPSGLLGHKRGGIYPPVCSRDYLVQFTLAKYLTEYESATYLIDKLKGVTTGITDGRTEQGTNKLVGNGSMYGQVYKEDGTAFTDADLPTNYDIEYDGIYNTDLSGDKGIFGCDSGGSDRYYFTSKDALGTFTLGVYDGVIIPSGIDIQVDDPINVKLSVNGPKYTLDINGQLYEDIPFTKVLSNNILQVLTLGSGSGVSEHECNYFKVTNTDTNEEIMHFNFEDWDGSGSSPTTFIDKSGNDHQLLLQNATGADLEKVYAQGGDADEVGYGVSKALGSNKVSPFFWTEGRLSGGIFVTDAVYASITNSYIDGFTSSSTNVFGAVASDFVEIAYLAEYVKLTLDTIQNDVRIYVESYDNDYSYLRTVSDLIGQGSGEKELDLTLISTDVYARIIVVLPTTATTVDVSSIIYSRDDITYEAYQGYYRGVEEVAGGKNLINESRSITGKAITVDVDYYDYVSNSTRILSMPVHVKPNTNYVRNTVNTAKTIYFDADYKQVYYSGKNATLVAMSPSNAVFGCIEYDTTEPNIGALQFEEGTVSTGYEPFQGVQGTELINPIPQGTTIPKLANEYKAAAWIAGPVRAPLDFSGELRGDIRIVDGVVDLGTLPLYPLDEETFTQTNIDLTITSDPTQGSSRVISDTITSTNTLKTIKAKCEIISGSDNGTILVRNSEDSATILTLTMSVSNQEYSGTFTPVDGGYVLRYYANIGTSEVQEKRYYNFIVFEGTEEPTTGQPVTGNSLIQATNKYSLVQVDKLLNGGSGLWWDHTDPNNVVANVLAVADLLGTVYNKQHFVAIEEWVQTFYSQALDISCVEKVELFLEMLEQVFVVEGAVMVGTEKVYVLKDEVDQL